MAESSERRSNGAAIPVMHSTGMTAASFTPSAVAPDVSHAVHVSALGITGITSVTLLVLGLAVLTSLLDRRFSAQSTALQASELLHRQLVESVQAILWRRNAKTSRFSLVRKEAEVILGYPVEQRFRDTPPLASTFPESSRSCPDRRVSNLGTTVPVWVSKHVTAATANMQDQ